MIETLLSILIYFAIGLVFAIYVGRRMERMQEKHEVEFFHFNMVMVISMVAWPFYLVVHIVKSIQRGSLRADDWDKK